MIEIVRHLDSNNYLLQKLPVFGTEDFLAAKSPNYGWCISDEFALPFIIDTRLGFKRLVFTTETIRLREGSSAESERAFLDDIVETCRSKAPMRVDFIATPQANSVFREIPSESESVGWGSFIVDLTQPDAAMFEAFHSHHRRAVRYASNGGVLVTTTNDTEVIYQTLRQTMVRQKLPFFPSRSYLHALQDRLKDNLTFYIALHESKVQGAAVVLHNHLGAFYYYGGSVERPFRGSVNLMHYEIMKNLKRQSIPVYDFMGARLVTGGDSKIEGIQTFKSRFATGMRKGYSFRRVLNPIRHRMFVLAVKGYCALRGSRYSGDVIDQARQSQQEPAPDLGATTLTKC